MRHINHSLKDKAPSIALSYFFKNNNKKTLHNSK